MLKIKEVPIPVTLSDCVLLFQMGYTTEVNDGQIITVKRDKKHFLRKCLGST